MIMKKNFSIAIFMAAMILFAGCNGENPGNSEASAEEITVSESSAAQASETVTESVSVTVSEAAAEFSPNQVEIPQEKKSYEPYEIKFYNRLGTGIPRPDDYGMDRIRYYADGKLEDILSLLKDKDVSGKIESGIKEWLDFLEENYDYSYEQLTNNELFYTSCDTYNGILFYVKSVRNSWDEKYYAVFDLRTGERLELSDMFFEGEEFIGELNRKLWEEIQKLTFTGDDIYTVEYIPMKREFAGLTENGFYFDVYDFYFPANNPYFTESIRMSVSLFDFDTVLNVPYDMTELFEDAADEILRFGSTDYNFTTSFFKQTGNIDIYLLDESPKLTEEQREFLNNKALSLTEMVDELNQEYGWTAYTDNDEPLYNAYVYDGTRYEYRDIFEISIGVTNDIVQIKFRQDNVYEDPNPEYILHYDLKTFELLDTEQIFERVFGDKEYVWTWNSVYQTGSEGWDRVSDAEGFIVGEAPDISQLKTENISVYDKTIYYDSITDERVIWGDIHIKADD